MNNIVLAGRLTKQPELKTTNSGIEVLSFSIAVNRPYAKKDDEVTADFINCVAWKKTAAFINKFFNKGDGIVLRGSLQSRKWVDNTGNNRMAYEVNVEQVEFAQGKANQNNTYSQPTQNTYSAPTSPTDELPVDDLPF